MMNDYDESAVKTLIPKNLDDVIKLNRHNSFLAIESDQQIFDLYAPIHYEDDLKAITNWRFIRLCCLGRSATHLFGEARPGNLRLTSPVLNIDLDRSLVITRSFSLYQLGKPGKIHFSEFELLSLCVLLNKTPIGEVLGVPNWKLANSYFEQ